jgi:hypothetical protein
MMPHDPQWTPVPLGTRLAAGCGGALFGASLAIGIGVFALWRGVWSTAEGVRGDPGFAIFAITAIILYGLIGLAILGLIVGAIAGALCMASAGRTGRVPLVAFLGFPLAGALIVWGGVSYGRPGPPSAGKGPRIAGMAPTAQPDRRSEMAVPAPAANQAPAPPDGSKPPDQQTADDAVRYAQPAPKPTVEEMQEYARQAEQDAPSVLGEWLYPGARAIPFTPRPGDVRYPLLGLETTDDAEKVIAFYERLAPGGAKEGDVYLLHGKRPSDDRATEIRISVYQNKTFIRFDAR